MPLLRQLKAYDRITGMFKIARRYFVLNAFDGAITMLGLLLGSYFAGIVDAQKIVVIGFSAAIAVSISGVWGAFYAEVAEAKRELRELENLLLRRLDKTELQKAFTFSSYVVAAVDGLSPFLSSVIILSPFLAASKGLLPVYDAYYYSFGLAFFLLFVLGAFLGRLSRENPALMGLKLVLAGVLAAAASLILS